MNCPKCAFPLEHAETECPACGIVLEKFLGKQRKSSSAPLPVSVPENGTAENKYRDLFFYVNPETNIFQFAGRLLVLLALIAYGQKFLFSSVESNYSGESFLHLVNLPFHEAGHLLFRFFGRFMTVLGGSLTQLLIPLICLAVFLLKTRDTFGASVSLWWTGENFLDLAPYVNDARALKLVLLGGVTGQDVDDYHDWEYLLRQLGLLQYDRNLAGAAALIGKSLIVLACLWGGYLLFRQFKNRSETY